MRRPCNNGVEKTPTIYIFYLELAIDRTEFIKLYDFDSAEHDPQTLIDDAYNKDNASTPSPVDDPDDNSDLLKSLGM